jgi:hypothetical protein
MLRWNSWLTPQAASAARKISKLKDRLAGDQPGTRLGTASDAATISATMSQPTQVRRAMTIITAR